MTILPIWIANGIIPCKSKFSKNFYAKLLWFCVLSEYVNYIHKEIYIWVRDYSMWVGIKVKYLKTIFSVSYKVYLPAFA